MIEIAIPILFGVCIALLMILYGEDIIFWIKSKLK